MSERDPTATTAEASDEPTPRTVAIALAVSVGLLIAGMAVNIGSAVAALFLFGVESVQSGGAGFLVATVVGQALVFAVAFGYVRWRRLGVPVDLPSRGEFLVVGAGVVASIVAAVGLTVLRQHLIPTETTSGLGEVLSANPSLALVVGVLSVLLVAPAEELLFRGAIQGRLRSTIGRWPAVAGASTLFAAWHLLNFGGSLVGTLAAAGIIGAVSLLWGYAYERTGNFAVPVLTHGLYNFTLMLLSYLSI